MFARGILSSLLQLYANRSDTNEGSGMCRRHRGSFIGKAPSTQKDQGSLRKEGKEYDKPPSVARPDGATATVSPQADHHGRRPRGNCAGAAWVPGELG